MTLHESIAKLQEVLPKLTTSDAKFASDLIASFKKYGGQLTPKQTPWVEKLIARAEHPKAFYAPTLAVPAGVNVGNFSGVVELFNKAKEHLKFPKIRLVVNGTHVVLSLNGPKSKMPGAVSINGEGKYPNREYYGRVNPDGAFFPFAKPAQYKTPADFTDALITVLTELGKNPARVAKDHGKLTGNCAFCGKVLGLGEDQRSVLVGFGPVCAVHYGLKAEWLAAADKAEAKASVVAPDPTLLVNVLADAGVTKDVLDMVPDGMTVKNLLVQYPPETTDDSFVPFNLVTIEPVVHSDVQSDGYDTGVAQKVVSGHIESLTEPKTCFFCEQTSTDTKTLHGFTVCSACVAQLK